MTGRCVRDWYSRIAACVAGLAICLATAATTLAPPPVDDGMVKRAVAGAEWLAARATEAPERIEGVTDVTDVTDLTAWLLVAGGGNGVGYEAFATYLAGVGYGDPLFSVQTWLEDFPRVVAAGEAARQGVELRPIREIEAEIRTLPIVPLDEAGEAERDRLINELSLAVSPPDARRAAAAAADRIEALRALAGLGDEQ